MVDRTGIQLVRTTALRVGDVVLLQRQPPERYTLHPVTEMLRDRVKCQGFVIRLDEGPQWVLCAVMADLGRGQITDERP